MPDRNRLSLCLILLCAGLLACPWPAPAQEEPFAPDWHISGQNVLHLDYYDSTGPSGAYQHEGWRPYNDLNLQFQNRSNPYNVLKGYFSGTINGSPYRSNEYGLVPERFNLNQENGDAALPYRLDLGDYHGFQTPRILQRSLKGVQVELQPGSLWGANHSLLIQGGSVARDYLDNRRGDNLFGGGSWLLNWDKTRASLNFLYNRVASQPGTPELRQHVAGLALSRNFSLLDQKLVLDAEWNHLRGEGPSGGAALTDEGQGRFAQIQGRATIPLTYSLRYEDYDAAYAPRGGVVSAGRRSFDGRAGWQSAAGYSITGRGQYFRDGIGSSTVTDTGVAGLGVSGNLPNPWIKGLNAGLDAYRQEAASDPSKTLIHSLNANLSAPLPGGWTSRLTASIQDTNVRRGIASDSRTQQVGVDLGHAISLAGFSGSANVGLVYSLLRQTGQDSDDVGVNFSSFLGQGPYRLNLSYRHLQQNRPATLVDNLNQGLNVAGEYTLGQHQFRLEADFGMRKPENQPESSDARVGLTWTFTFERPALAARAVAAEVPAARPDPAAAPLVAEPLSIFTLADLRPGLPLEQATTALAGRGIRDGIRQGRHTVFEAAWFDDVSQRQRLVLTASQQSLERASVIVDLNQVGDLDNVGQLYERLRSRLNREFGSPTTQETGSFGPNLARDLRAGTFVRVSDWKTPTGVLRLGIPRRLDGVVRIEVQHAQSFPLSGHVSWGIEEIQ
jgi:hypothetical protein